MKKLAPMRRTTMDESVALYDRLYEDTEHFIRMKLKWRGQHSLLVHLLKKELRGAAVLDVGCGFGRFTFLSARLANRVWGLDMTPGALRVAVALKEALGVRNVEFVLTDVEGFDSPRARYDVIYLGGVLEHLMDPVPVLTRIRSLLANDGVLVMNCPREGNFRGDVSTTLLKLFDFPMTLSDVRQVTPRYVEQLCRAVGFDLVRMVGCYYSRGWTEMAAEDLKVRIPAVLHDVRDQIGGLRVRPDIFLDWVAERTEENRALLDYLVARRILKQIPARPEFVIQDNVLVEHQLPVAAIREYLKGDFSREPYYCDVAPFNLMGGQTIYFLRRRQAARRAQRV